LKKDEFDLLGPGMRSAPEAGVVKQSGLGCEEMFDEERTAGSSSF